MGPVGWSMRSASATLGAALAGAGDDAGCARARPPPAGGRRPGRCTPPGARRGRDRRRSGGRDAGRGGHRVDMGARRRVLPPGSVRGRATIGAWPVTSIDRCARRGSSTPCARPIGRYGGALAVGPPRRPRRASSLRAIVERTGIDPALVEDVILGCANQAGEDNRNVARMAALLAGLPVEVAGQTVNRLCGSGLQAINAAAHAIGAGDGDVFIAGGVESMTRAPYVMAQARGARSSAAPATIEDTTLGWRFVNPRMQEALPADLDGRDGRERRRAQWTRRRASARTRSRSRASGAPPPRSRRAGSPTQLVPVERRRAQGRADRRRPRRAPARRDVARGARRAQARVPRPAAPSPPATRPGSTTARRRCCSSRRIARASSGSRPLARVVATAVAGVDPDVMGIGPVPAVAQGARRGRASTVARPRRRRAQRGVRVAVRRLHGRARARPGARQRRTAARSRWATRWVRRARAW